MARLEARFRLSPMGAFAHVQRGRGRERRRGRERLGKRRTGTKTHDRGYRLSQSDRSIGSALRQHARAFPYRGPACFSPQSSSSSFSSSAFGFAQRVVGARSGTYSRCMNVRRRTRGSACLQATDPKLVSKERKNIGNIRDLLVKRTANTVTER